MKLEDLPPAVQQLAYEKWCEHGPHDEWWEGIYELAIEDGKERGFEIENIFFSGFCSQGDGACWKGRICLSAFFNYFRERDDSPLSPQQVLLLSSAIPVLYDTVPDITARGNYSHSGTMSIDWTYYTDAYDEVKEGAYTGMDEEDFDALWEQHASDIEGTLLQSARDFADEIYENLEAEYDYLISEECFREWAQGVEFDEEGEML